MLIYFAQNTINGGGGVEFHNSGHRLALGHVNVLGVWKKYV